MKTSVKHVQNFLQFKSETLAVNKGYVTAISHRHAMVRSATLSLDTSILRSINGLEHMKGIPHMTLPYWCLELVLVALTKVPFEPIETCLNNLTWKTVFLLAITSGRRASEMHALCYKPPYIRFSSAGDTLFMRLEFLGTKVCTKANVSPPIFVLAMRNLTNGALRRLCVCRALNEYVRRSSDFRQDSTAQLFVVYCDESRANPSPSRDSNWLVEYIKFAYDKHNLPTPEGVKGHQTGKMAVTYADMASADPHTIYEAATWANTKYVWQVLSTRPHHQLQC